MLRRHLASYADLVISLTLTHRKDIRRQFACRQVEHQSSSLRLHKDGLRSDKKLRIQRYMIRPNRPAMVDKLIQVDISLLDSIEEIVVRILKEKRVDGATGKHALSLVDASVEGEGEHGCLREDQNVVIHFIDLLDGAICVPFPLKLAETVKECKMAFLLVDQDVGLL